MVISKYKFITTVIRCQYQTVMKAGVGMNNYYPRLKDLREDSDLTQQNIADYLGMKQSQYSRYERGLREKDLHFSKNVI